MIRTRVGYAGGTKKNPTYYSLADHTETIQIDYDPSVISYRQLLDIFWQSHDPLDRPRSSQYKAAIFFNSAEQQRQARESRDLEAARRKQPVHTEILSLDEFYKAEDYHQKYRLQQEPDLMKEFEAIYPASQDFINSTSAARVNGYLGGYGSPEGLKAEINSLGLSEKARKKLVEILSIYRPAFRSCPVK